MRKIIRADKYAIKTLPWNHLQRPNLTLAEKRAIKELQHSNNIVLKPADKGSAVVIMDRIAYIGEAYRQLNQSQYYKKLNESLASKTDPKILKILHTLKEEGYINRKQLTYLRGVDNPRTRRFYLLPKIHKDPKSWSIPFEMPPGRPIVSDCGSNTYATAEFIEHYLNPISNQHPSYIRDTYDFIDKVRNLVLPIDCFLFTIDIDSLYTNIGTSAGVEAIMEWFKRYPDGKKPDKHVIDLLKINLTENDFEFNSEYFLQVKGTAMGKRFAPSYANIFMAKWEEEALSAWPIKPLHYFRFLDDIWGVWKESEKEFKEFVNHLDHFNESIKIKYNLHQSAVNFLDMITYKGDDFKNTHKLQTRVYFKETDTHALLHKNSFHPRHTFKGVLKSQLLRFHLICSYPEDFWKATKILFGTLRKRGYSRSLLRNCLKRFLGGGTGEGVATTENLEIILFVSTYSNCSVILNRKIKENFKKFTTKETGLDKYKIISAYKKNNNLKDLLADVVSRFLFHGLFMSRV
ncbi:hypothetical protein QTP86_009060 [Hemibagrus guttatus]|nr:hypothetical protein QTP86_009060 [Hemibagrus guttatus]